MSVYLIHFERPLRHARHYLGSTRKLENRLADHRSGRGARLLQVLGELGIDWVVARTWKGGRSLERSLKNQKNSPRLCPICNLHLKRKPYRTS